VPFVVNGFWFSDVKLIHAILKSLSTAQDSTQFLYLPICYYPCSYTVFGAENTRFWECFQTARQTRHLAASA
jgi:hypothetical protein